MRCILARPFFPSNSARAVNPAISSWAITKYEKNYSRLHSVTRSARIIIGPATKRCCPKTSMRAIVSFNCIFPTVSLISTMYFSSSPNSTRLRRGSSLDPNRFRIGPQTFPAPSRYLQLLWSAISDTIHRKCR